MLPTDATTTPYDAIGVAVVFREGCVALGQRSLMRWTSTRVPLDGEGVVVAPHSSRWLPVRLKAPAWSCDEAESRCAALWDRAMALCGPVRVSDAALAVPIQTPPERRRPCPSGSAAVQLSNLHLVDEDVALAIAAADRDEHNVCHQLIVNVGFDRTDVSLASSLQGTVRIRDRIHVDSWSLAALDEIILAKCLDAVQFAPRASSEWQACWKDVEKIRLRLETLPKLRYFLSAETWKRTSQIEFSREDVFAQLGQELIPVLHAAQMLVEDNQLAIGDLRQVILCGGGPICWPNAMGLISERFPVSVRLLSLDDIAVGACQYAMSPDELTTSQLRPRPEADAASRAAAVTRAPSAKTEHVGPEVSPGPSRELVPRPDHPSPVDALWQYLRDLAVTQPSEAIQIASQLRAQLDGFLQFALTLPTAAGDDRPGPAWELLRQAERLLSQGFPAESVQMSHEALNQAPGDPQIFRAMLDLHVAAAATAKDAKTAIAWLRCAHVHDESDRRIHQLLSEQYLRLADEFTSANQLYQALEAVQECLTFAPSHAVARQKKAQLQAQCAQLSTITDG